MSHSHLSCAAAISTDADARAAARSVGRAVRERLSAPADLALVFASAHHAGEFAELAEEVRRAIEPRSIIGCTGESIVGGPQEVEGSPALSLFAATLPGATATAMHLRFERTIDGGTFSGWPDGGFESSSSTSADGDATLLLVGDPFSFPADALLARLNEDQPGLAVAGGMASGASRPGENRLLVDGKVYNEGAAAVFISGPVALRTVVSQGCRPVGKPLVVTKAHDNVIELLGGRPPLEQLRELWPTLSERDQRLVQGSLHVGRVINEYQDRFARGDFLVRNVMGLDGDSGALAIADHVRAGQTVQFHVRDAETADEDLRELLSAARRLAADPPAGALLFTCNGRGTRLFDAPHHDAAALAAIVQNDAVAGFFAQGEIGRVGSKNFLHGFTASAVLFGVPSA